MESKRCFLFQKLLIRDCIVVTRRRITEKEEEKSTFYCYKLTYYVGTKIVNMFHKITKYCTGMTKHIKQWSWRTVRFG